MPEWVNRLFTKRDNLLSLLIIAIAFTIVIIDILGTALPEDAIIESILVILGLVALTNIIEREIRFGEMCAKIEQKPLFERQFQIPTIPQYMQTSQEFFYSGGHAHTLVNNHTNLFEKWLREGKSLRFLLQDPDNEGLRNLKMPCVNYSHRVYVARIEDTLNTLKTLKAKYPSARLGVRVTDVTPTQSISIYDGHRGGTRLCMFLHLPNGEAASAPFVRVEKSQSGEWFSLFYERYYEILWNNAKVVIKHPDDE